MYLPDEVISLDLRSGGHFGGRWKFADSARYHI